MKTFSPTKLDGATSIVAGAHARWVSHSWSIVWSQKGIHPKFTSAATILSALQFYMLPQHDALIPLWTKGLPADRVFDPIVELIQKRGGQVEPALEVESIGIRHGEVRSIDVGEGGGDSTGELVEIARLDAAVIPGDRFSPFDTDDGGTVLVRRYGEEFRAFLPVCSHHAGPLSWDAGRPTKTAANWRS